VFWRATRRAKSGIRDLSASTTGLCVGESSRWYLIEGPLAMQAEHLQFCRRGITCGQNIACAVVGGDRRDEGSDERQAGTRMPCRMLAFRRSRKYRAGCKRGDGREDWQSVCAVT
jgi:hypothetical protein